MPILLNSKKVFLLVFLLLCKWQFVQAQRDFTADHYMFSGVFINPAMAGMVKYPNFTALNRNDFSSNKRAPLAQYFSFTSKITNTPSNVAFLVSREAAGYSSQISAYGIYSYSIRVGDEALLSFGLRAGMTNTSSRLSELSVLNTGDPVFAADAQSMNIRAGAGLVYHTNAYYVGLSVPYLIDKASTIVPSIKNSAANTAYNLTAGYLWQLSRKVLLRPTCLMRYDAAYVNNNNKHYDINGALCVLFAKTVWLGTSYSSVGRMSEIVDMKLTPELRLGYAFEHSMFQLAGSGINPIHEIVIAYDLGYDIKHPRNPKYF